MTFLDGLVFFAPVALLVRTMAGVSVGQFFLLQAVLSFSILVLEIPAGKFTDRFGYRNTIVLSQVTLLFARTLLLLAYLWRSFPLFLLEAVAEGLASSFDSGTRSAYLYVMFPGNEYVAKNARVKNWGTLGFIASTISYAAIYSAARLSGLLLSTIAANTLAVAVSLGMEKEGTHTSRRESTDTVQISREHFARALFQRKSLVLIAALSTISVGRILINFFYADRLISCGIREEWLTPIILGYSIVELAAEKILARTGKAQYPHLFALTFGLSAACMIAFGLAGHTALVLLLMLIMPLLLDIPSCILDSFQNEFVDTAGQEEKRAEMLSALNMGVNLFEIAFLFASSAVSGIGASMCFVGLGAAMLAVGQAVRREFS